jgi:uncharacterized glyoxalase superfamily protein PhnB
MNIPNNYQTVMPYLILKGASDFIRYTKNVFNATENENVRSMRSENVIMHSEIVIGGCTIMFADSTEKFPPRTCGFFIYVENADETHKKAVAEGGVAVSKVENHDYGRSGGVEDPFGNVWWITSMK